MARKIVPIGEVTNDDEREFLSIDGVIEETPNGQFIDPQKRTYLDVQVNEEGTKDVSGLFLRERTDAEKKADLARILCQEPTLVSIIRDTRLSELPVALTHHAYQQTRDFVINTATSIRRAVRKSRLERQLDKQEIPYGRGRNFDLDTFEFESNALNYAWSVVGSIADEYGVNSELFDEVASKLLTKREKDTVIKNSLSGENPRMGIATVEDRRYDHKKVTQLYKSAIALAEKYGITPYEPKYLEDIRSKVETSPFFLRSRE